MSFERLKHTVRAKVSSILWKSEGDRWSGTFTGDGLGGRCKTYRVFLDCATFSRRRRTIGVDDKECLQDVL